MMVSIVESSRLELDVQIPQWRKVDRRPEEQQQE